METIKAKFCWKNLRVDGKYRLSASVTHFPAWVCYNPKGCRIVVDWGPKGDSSLRCHCGGLLFVISKIGNSRGLFMIFLLSEKGVLKIEHIHLRDMEVDIEAEKDLQRKALFKSWIFVCLKARELLPTLCSRVLSSYIVGTIWNQGWNLDFQQAKHVSSLLSYHSIP